MIRKTVALVLAVSFLVSFLANSQGSVPVVVWEEAFPNAGDEAHSIIQTDDGYVVVGTGNSKSGVLDGYLFKLDTYGNMQWNKSYEGNFRAVVQTSDGGYALSGFPVLIKINSEGNTQWSKNYLDTYAFSMVQTRDNSYTIAGYTKTGEYWNGKNIYDFWLAKINSEGTLLWNKTYGGSGNDQAYSVVQTSEGGYALAGKSNSTSGSEYEFWLVKTDAMGNMEWNRTYGGADGDSQANSIIQTDDGGYVLAGNTNAFGAGLSDAWLVKTDSSGDIVWNQTYGGTGELPDFYGTTGEGVPVAGSNGTADDYANSLIQTSDGGLAFVGASHATSSTLVWLVKTDATGHSQWNATYGTFEGSTYTFWGNSLIETSDGAFAIAGYKTVPSFPWHGQYYIIKTEAVLPPPTPKSTYSLAISPTPNQEIPQTEFDVIIALAAIILIVISASLGLLVYHKKRKEAARQA